MNALLDQVTVAPPVWMTYVDLLGPTIVGAVGLVAILLQLRHQGEERRIGEQSIQGELRNTRDQIAALQNQTRSSAIGDLYLHQNGITEFFLTNIDLRAYFYTKNQNLPSAELKPEVDAACELLLDFFEHIYLQQEQLPKDVWNGWLMYMIEIYSNSRVLSEFFGMNRARYGNDLWQAITRTNT